ncbi:MAG TPA: 23S rRNA (uracil(1939)-C(5))-methyltransferase RlmD [Gammaproteobacteria bacterium]|nr:23S rRNA (uracil(1939)-C(5))-methyltransferase RlmD [Gammaproteobacteria bacterium]
MVSNMKQREPITVAIKSLSEDGCGYSEDERYAVYGSLVGELVSAVPLARKRQRLYLRTTEVFEASPDRVEPKCSVASVCGGCSLQHMRRDAQLALKSDYVREQLAPLRPEQWLAPIVGADFGYRTKARFGVKYVEKKNRVLVGFREKQIPFIVDAEQCIILTDRCGQLINDLENLVERLSIKRAIPQVELAAGDSDVALVFRHLESFNDADFEVLRLYSEETGFRIWVQSAGPDSVRQIYPESGSNTLTYRLPEFDLTFSFGPLDFTQVNLEVNRQMVNLAYSLLEPSPSDRILDAFCGIGNFSLALATSAEWVSGLELSIESVARAESNAKENSVDNVSFSVADLYQEPILLPVDIEFNKVLLDPPRSGAEAVVKELARWDVEKVVYVSCNPKTLARDAKILIQQGFALQSAGIINMFPHTTHVESIAAFARS